MAFLQTTATGLNDLLNVLHTFLVPSGGDGTWTDEYNELVTPYRQMSVSKGNCHIAFGSETTTVDTDHSGQTDSAISGALATSITSNTGSETYAGHTGSIVTSETDGDRTLCNDLGESYNNVWLMSGTTPVSYCHMIVQVSGERYTHMSFGIADPLDQTHTDCPYLVALDHEWWTDSVQANDPGSGSHNVGHYCENNMQVGIWDTNVLPIGFGPAAGFYNGRNVALNMHRVTNPSEHYAVGSGAINDYFMALDNQTVTGGTPMFGLPILFAEDISPSEGVWLGNIPDVRMVNILSHSPGETIKFGSEEWIVFPLKRKGGLDEVDGGSSEIATANTSKLGLAYKKVV